MDKLSLLRNEIRANHIADEDLMLRRLMEEAGIGQAARDQIAQNAVQLVRDVRGDDQPGLMEVFLAEYGLSTDEGIALMCLAEALLRVPDADTIDKLIEDKIAPSSWGEHLGKSSSSLVNASTWALMLTGKVLREEDSTGTAGVLHGAVKRLGEPVIRSAVKRAMKEMGNQFVLGETIERAMDRGAAMEKLGYTYSYDMLGEAALTAGDADEFFKAYRASIELLAKRAKFDRIQDNPGISIKLSALHPRYEVSQKSRVMTELVGRVLELAIQAKAANIGLNIDAEEADRLDLSLDVIEAVLSDNRLAGWKGFGVVVQAYGKRAAKVIDWLYALSEKVSRQIMVRLVKGAYWDTEIKRAQVEGLAGFPVYTQKNSTDVSYICCAKKLLQMTDRIYPQFATHNAHSVCAIIEMAQADQEYEFQRLHGMGEAMHRQVMQAHGTRCRIYAPVGAHRDLLAYLVRRLLENGANSSFVNQIVDETVPAETVAADPFGVLSSAKSTSGGISKPRDLYQPERTNSRGWDLRNIDNLSQIEQERAPFMKTKWQATSLLAVPYEGLSPKEMSNPSDETDVLGTVVELTASDVTAALSAARDWQKTLPCDRAKILNQAANLFEEHHGEFFAVLAREAGKNPADAVAELREAVDFFRYYATQCEPAEDMEARGLIACISPWNFPLAIFTGQIAAALAAGNGVLAKPAEQTPITATIAVKLMHQAGVPREVLQLLPGSGAIVGAAIVADERTSGVSFTGSTATAQIINASMAKEIDPSAPLIAETGGLNAMIVDSTALPEQAVKDIVASAFQSAGQRCSALRLLYLQEDVAPIFLEMLYGAMDELTIGNPWDNSTDVGPVITADAKREIQNHVDNAKEQGRLLKQLAVPSDGHFVGPAVLAVDGMSDMEKEIFGPVLHVATFKSGQIDKIIDDINAAGYGLTFGLHTRIDDRVEKLTSRLNVGNMYINRNQIGAIVGSQPFGGEGLSGTGPKAGGPNYVRRFRKEGDRQVHSVIEANPVQPDMVQTLIDVLPRQERIALNTVDLPGPTGESNRLSIFPRGTVLCLGPTPKDARMQVAIARNMGCNALAVCSGADKNAGVDGFLTRSDLTALTGIGAVALWSDEADLRQARIALAERSGAIVPLLSERDFSDRCTVERHICIDTTASGGNVALLSSLS